MIEDDVRAAHSTRMREHKGPGLTVPLTLLGRANEVSQILARRVNRVLP